MHSKFYAFCILYLLYSIDCSFPTFHVRTCHCCKTYLLFDGHIKPFKDKIVSVSESVPQTDNVRRASLFRRDGISDYWQIGSWLLAPVQSMPSHDNKYGCEGYYEWVNDKHLCEFVEWRVSGSILSHEDFTTGINNYFGRWCRDLSN